MPRATNKIAKRKRHKKVLKAAKGYFGRKKNVYKLAHQQLMKSGQYSYRDRRTKKRNFRTLWIARINAAARAEGMTYSQFMSNLHKKGIMLNRKALAEIAFAKPQSFKELVAALKG